MSVRSRLLLICAVLLTMSFGVALADPPSSYDLRDVGGVNYVTSVKSQIDGTCWTHGAMAAIEGNLLMTGNWTANGESGEPNLAEYHLDWWNGFNQHNNDDLDPPSGAGLEVHQGGDYMVTQAYLGRGEGAVRDIDGQSHTPAPPRSDSSWHYYYPTDVEWLVAGENLENINTIKEHIMTYGVLGTCMCYDASFIQNYIHYQPPTSTLDPNHAVAIIGWDDNLITQAPLPGAWLVKNSWGSSWGNSGYFWISYYDKHSCQNIEMGAISYQNVIPMPYDFVYYHDYHGQRNIRTDVSEAMNAFVAEQTHILEAVSFYTADDSVDYTARVYDSFDGSSPSDLLAEISGTAGLRGFHTFELPTDITLDEGNDFYIYVSLSAGGHPYDQTSDVPVLLGAKYRVIVESDASAGESFYWDGGAWKDLYSEDTTANFCIKGLCTNLPSKLNLMFPQALPTLVAPGVETTVQIQVEDGSETYVPGTATLYYCIDDNPFTAVSMSEMRGVYEASLPIANCGEQVKYYFAAQASDGTVLYLPYNGEADPYTAEVGTITALMSDNFDTNQGWTTANVGASSGLWQRGIPVDDDAWDYDPESDGDGSGYCYLTDNGMGNTDVDGGEVMLLSPAMDLTGGASIEYDYFLYLTNTDGGVDRLLVEISANGDLGPWTEIARHDENHGLYWAHNVISSDYITGQGVVFSSNMVVRFSVNDGDPQSVVEAGIDGFAVNQFSCVSPSCCVGITGNVNGDPGDNVDISDLTTLVNNLFVTFEPLGCNAEANTSGDTECTVDISDLTKIVNHLFVTFEALPACVPGCTD